MKAKNIRVPEPKLDTDRVDEAILALMYLNFCSSGTVWKSFDWSATGRLFEKGLISDPVGKAKSVGFTEEGERRAKELFEQLFTVKEE